MARVVKASSTLAGRTKVYTLLLLGLLTVALLLTRTSWGIAGLLLMVVVRSLFDRFFSTFSGNVGEQRVARYLRTLPDSWVVFNDITFHTAVGKAQIDHLVVAPTGIILLETKNHQGLITAYGPNWTQHLGQSKSRFYSPVNQAQGHERVLKAFLKSNGLNISVKSFVVFTNSHVSLSVPREVFGITVKTLDECKDGIIGPTGPILGEPVVKKLVDLIAAADSPNLSFVDRLARRIDRKERREA